MQTVKQYIEYFQGLATNHPDLQHSESGETAFAVMSLFDYAAGQYRASLNEKGYAFLLLLPNERLGANNTRYINAGFVILHYHSHREGINTDFYDAIGKAHKVGYDFIQRMLYDSRQESELFDSSIDDSEDLNLNVEPQVNAGDTSYSGFLFSFQFRNGWLDCIEESGVGWLDLDVVIGYDPNEEIIGDDDDNLIGN